jgi:hypothetical protein
VVPGDHGTDPARVCPAEPACRIIYEPGDQIKRDLVFPETKIPCGPGRERCSPGWC